jgi:hypothetical protein
MKFTIYVANIKKNPQTYTTFSPKTSGMNLNRILNYV